MTKHLYLFLFLIALVGWHTDVHAQPANDECATATSLGTLGTPAACTGNGIKKGATTTLTNQTNIAATPSTPYPYISACTPNTASLPNDVWYSFVASSYQANIKVTGGTATLTNPVITVWSGICANLAGLGCVTGAAGAATLTVYQLVPGQTYYIQVSGSDATQNGNFSLAVYNADDCANCLVSSTLVATPPPVNGTYQPGQTVTFCFTVTAWDETNTNWLHGMQPSFGAGWNLATLTPGTPPASIDGLGTWAWYAAGVTSSATGNIWPAGYYYNSSDPNNYFGGPGNSFGDDCDDNLGQTCIWEFCVTITANSVCTPGSDLSATFNTSGDGESGVWSSLACTNDQPAIADAVGACCPPTMASTPTTCTSSTIGTATATPVGTLSPWTFEWSNTVTQTGLTGPSTISGLIAGTYTVTVVDNMSCSATASVVVGGAGSSNAGPSQNVSCVTLPGGSATMAATAAAGGVWTAQAGNPGTSTITTPSSATSTITNYSAPGTYTYIWTVAGCTSTTTVVVTAKPSPTVNSATVCLGTPVTLTATGGVSYVWSSGPTTPSITTATGGTYTVTATAANACTASATGTITTDALPTPTVNSPSVCAGTTATLTATGGVSYIWSSGPITPSITTTTAGTYTVTATNAAGCTATASGTVTVNALPTPTVNSATVCAGTNATLTATGGVSYVWSSGPTTPSITTTVAGTYTVTATNAAGCTATASGTITVNALPAPTVNNAAVCAGTTATLTATGGVSYVWSSGPTTPSITTGTAGTYTVTATNAAGCTATASGTVAVNALPTPTVNNATVCAGTNATLTATGGVSYIWSSGPTTPSIMTGTAGTYTVTATNAAGCTATASGTVTVNALPTPTVNNATICAGTTATLTATGGVSYIWSSGPTTPSITTNTAGTYTVTATNAAGCTATASGTITVNPLPTPSVTSAAVCAGSTATITASGGVSYVWSTTATTPSITTNTAGTYTVTATDANGCSATASGTVTVGVIPTPTVNNATVCSGDIATLTATGGIGYLWSTNAITPSITTTVAGTYTVTATNIDGCTATASGTVTVNPLPTPSVNNATVCSGNTATLTATGGVSYVWSTTATTPSITTGTAGTYTVTATDANSCSATASGTLTVNPLPTPSVNNTSVCTGNTATLTATGGVSYQWNTLATTPSITTNTAGTYTVTATDVNGCSATASGTVTLYALPVASVNTIPAVCTSANGMAIAIVNSGTPNYGYSWSAPGGTDDTLANLTSGSYTVNVTDANGCTATATGIVSQLTPGITVNETSQHNLSCNNDASGAIYITATDLAGPGPFNFTYNWGSSGSSQNLTGQQAGTYTVVVTDQFGCTGTASYIITQPTPLTGSTTTVNPQCFGQSNGSATLTPSGGSPNYTYSWNSSPVQTTAQATNLPAGTYTVVLTDDSLCQATVTVTLIDPQQITFGASIITDPSCFTATNGSAQVAPQNGIGSYSYTWNTNPVQTSNPATGLASGSYSVTATDNNGCTAATTVNLIAPSQVSVAASSTNVTCFGSDNGTASASATGGTPPYTYIWNNEDSTANINGLVASTYNVTATDANGCTADNSTTITQPSAVSESLSSIRINCPNTDDGTITATAGGGTGAFTYTLENASGTTVIQSGNTTGSFTGIGYGLYTIVATDANGCFVSDTITVPRAPFNYYTDTATSTSCYGPQYTDGTIHLQGYSIPNGPFQYSIDGGAFQVTPDFFNLTAGTHSVTAQDNYGCDTTFSIVVPQPLPATVQILPGDSTVTAGTTVQLTTNFGPYSTSAISSYSWSPGTGMSCIDCPNPQVSPYNNVTTYTVLITYNQGCTVSASVQITINGEPPIYVPNAFTPNGDGINDVWYVYGTGIKDIKAMIFDRWGEKVFESDDQSQGWDGTFRGQIQPPGVFVYLVNVVYLDGTTDSKQGSLSLIR